MTLSKFPYPTAGDIYSFRTPPATEFSASETGRYAGLKVLYADDECFIVAALEGVWTATPSLELLGKAEILQEHRLWNRGNEACWVVSADDGWCPSDMPEFTLVGKTPLSDRERDLVHQYTNMMVGTCHGPMIFAGKAAEGEWRWQHDRDAFVAEFERQKAKYLALSEAQELRYRQRLKGLTWEQLLSETPFKNWENSPPYPDAEFTARARAKIHETCKALRDLGPKPKKAAVRAVLKTCVEWFNQADDQAGGPIETDEREDICIVLEEMAFVARQKTLVDEIDDWRTW